MSLKTAKIALAVAAVSMILASNAVTQEENNDKRFQEKTFFSEALGVEKSYNIYLPPGYEADKNESYPVIYLLHGYNFTRNNPEINTTIEEQNHWIVQEQIPQIADCLFTRDSYEALDSCMDEKGVEFPEAVVKDMKEEYPECPLPLPPMIVVMPDGDASFYMDRPDGKKTWPPMDGPEFVDGVRRGATGQYETYIYRDLVNHVDSTYRTMAQRDKRGIGGFSMGGIGSMNLLLGHPDVFISVSAHSAMFTLTDFLNDPLAQGLEKSAPEIKLMFVTEKESGKQDIDIDLVKKNDPYYRLRDLKTKDVYIYYDAGSADFFSGMYNFKTFDRFARGLERKGLDSYPSKHIIEASEINGRGMHTGAFWRSRVGVALAFHAHAFGLL